MLHFPGMDALTIRQERFVREYLLDGNGTRSAIAAGYAPTSAAGMATYLLQRPQVRASLEQARIRMLARRDITVDRVLEEYRRLAFSDIRGLFNADGSMRAPSEWDDETAAAVAGLEVSRTRTTFPDTPGGPTIEDAIVKVKRWDKLKALEVLAKHTGVLVQASAPTARMDAPLDPARIARMDDTTLGDALALLARMDAGTDPPP